MIWSAIEKVLICGIYKGDFLNAHTDLTGSRLQINRLKVCFKILNMGRTISN